MVEDTAAGDREIGETQMERMARLSQLKMNVLRHVLVPKKIRTGYDGQFDAS
jgi:hypothetical protein